MLWLVAVAVQEHLVTLLRSAAQALYPVEPMGQLLLFPTRQATSTTVLVGTLKLSKEERRELDPKVRRAAAQVEARLVEELYPHHP
jgi:hypothetical protein